MGNDGNHRSLDEGERLLGSKDCRRQSSASSPLSALRRMGSKLMPKSNPTQDQKKGVFYSTANRLDESYLNKPLANPQLPLAEDATDSKESFFSSLNRLADQPNVCSNPAPGIEHKSTKKAFGSQQQDTSDLPTSRKPLRKLSDRFSRSNLFRRESSTTSFSCTADAPTPYSPSQRRETFVPIANLMGPIQPGNKISRSSTTGKLEYQQTALGSQRRTSAKPQPNFMRPTSASRARRNSTMPSSDTAVHQDPRRPSGGQPPALRTTPFNGSRLSSSKSNRALRAHVKSGDLSFREIYGSEEAGEGDTQDIEMGRPEVFKAEHYRAGSIRASGNENTMGTLDAQHRRATTLTDPEFCLVLEKYPRGPGTRTPPEKSLPQLAPIPDVDHDESKRASEAPCLLAELQPARFPEYEPAEPHAELGIMSEDCQEHIRPKCMSGLISSREGSMGNIKEKSNMKSSDQRESMGAYEERCLYAPPHLGLEQRDTAMRGGADEDDLTDTSLIKPSYMHFKGPPPRPKSEGEEDDVRNVYFAKPSSYWSGRASALDNRFRNEILTSSPRAALKHPMMDDARRLRRIAQELAQFCKTPEAKESMEEFMIAYWNSHRPSGLPRAISRVAFQQVSVQGQEGVRVEDGSGGKKGRGVLGRVFRRRSGA